VEESFSDRIKYQADVVNKIKCKDVVKFNRSLAN